MVKVRHARGQGSLTEQFRLQDKIDGQWTVFGLSRLLQVDRNWLYKRIKKGSVSASRHPATGHYLIADDPELIARLMAQAPRKRLA